MKALTVRQPWAGLIVEGHPKFGHKDVENRPWRTAHRGPLLIHAAIKWDPYDSDYGVVNKWFAGRAGSQRGMIVGVVDLVGICDGETNLCRSEWAREDHYHWQLTDPRPFPEPVPWTGRQGLWEVDLFDHDSFMAGALRDQLTGVGYILRGGE